MIGFEGFSLQIDNIVELALESNTKFFLTKTMKKVSGINIDIMSIEISEKFIVQGIKDGVRNKRVLQENNSDETKGLILVLAIQAQVQTSTLLPTDFSFGDLILYGFQNDFAQYKTLLRNDRTISNALLGNGTGGNQKPMDQATRSLSFYIYIGCSVAGGILIALFTILFIKHRYSRDIVRLPSNLTFQDENEFIRSQGTVGIPHGGDNMVVNGSRSNNMYNQYQGREIGDESNSNNTAEQQMYGVASSSTRTSNVAAATNPFMTWQGSFGELEFAPNNLRNHPIGDNDQANQVVRRTLFMELFLYFSLLKLNILLLFWE